MRCLVLTLALVVGAFAQVRFVEIQNLDKFKSSSYKTLSSAVKDPFSRIISDVLFVFDTEEDEYEDLLVAFQCPAGDSFVFKYGFGEEIRISKVDTSSLKIPQNLSLAMINSCEAKVFKRDENNQLTKADHAFLRKFTDDRVLYLKNDNTSASHIRNWIEFSGYPPTVTKYYEEAIKKYFGE